MPSPIETIAARVLAEHAPTYTDAATNPTTTFYCRPCSEAIGDWVTWTPSHGAAEIARAIAEDEGLESLLWAAIATARDANPRLPNDADTSDVAAAVIDALTREENR